MPPIYFSTWLFQQQARIDKVGEITRWALMVKLYKPCKTYHDFAKLFIELAPDHLIIHLPLLEKEFLQFLVERKKNKR